MAEGEVPIESPTIAAVRYMDVEEVLQVRLRNGRVYRHIGVPVEMHRALMRSSSREAYLDTKIVPAFETCEVPIRIEEVSVQNFRSIKDLTVRMGDLTVLIGANGTGKTSFLDALALLMPGAPAPGDEDYYPGAEQIDVTIAIDPHGHEVPGRFLRGGVIRLKKSFTKGSPAGKAPVKAEAMISRDLDGVRDPETAEDAENKVRQLRKTHPNFPEYKGLKKLEADLAAYEHRLSQDPERRGDLEPGFVKYAEGQDLISRVLTVIPVPAMRDISADGREGSKSLLTELMNLAVRTAAEGDEAMREISSRLEEAHAAYRDAVRDTMAELADDLAVSSASYMDGAAFRIDLGEAGGTGSHPDASMLMRDNGHMAPVDRAGSGFQRVYLLSLLDTIANRRGGRGTKREEGAALPLRLIAIDEPELYQHPQRQRRILRNLISAVRYDPSTNVVCSTHSPYFVELRKIDCLRLFRKGERHEARSVTPEDLENIDRRIGWARSARERSTWLDMNATRWITEGFFARRVVVVEGPSDRNALLAAATAAHVDLDEIETTIVPADGIEKVGIVASIFKEFKIPAYLVWDLDGGREGARRRNVRLAGIASDGELKSAPRKTCVRDYLACFETNLTAALSAELCGCGDLLERMKEYKKLQDAISADTKSAKGWEEAGASRDAAAQKGTAGGQNGNMGGQKNVLKDKLCVYRMLERIRERDPGRLEKLTVVRIVRRLEKIGERPKGGSRGGRNPRARPAPGTPIYSRAAEGGR